jgi:hypothetical protein
MRRHFAKRSPLGHPLPPDKIFRVETTGMDAVADCFLAEGPEGLMVARDVYIGHGERKS